MTAQLVLAPALPFATLAAELASLGFRRDGSARPLTPDVLPGEPELAAWTAGDARLTYTFNPVVGLRVLAAREVPEETLALLAARLPLLGPADVRGILAESDRRRVLLGLFAARTLAASELSAPVGGLRAHPDPLVASAASSVFEALGATGGGGQATATTFPVAPEPAGGPDAREAVARREALILLRALSEQAIPVLSALVGPDGPAVIRTLEPRPEDYARVFAPEVAAPARAAYQELWRTPPEIDQLTSGSVRLKVDAAPAGMLREDNELSNHFPGGYRALAPYLKPDRIWFVWRYLAPGAGAGMRYDGLVRLDDRWAWFPKPYRVVGEILRAARG